MINFFRNPNDKVMGLLHLDPDRLIYRVLPRLFLEILRKYFRLQITGQENIPRRGPVIIAPNHSGYSGFDAMLLAYILATEIKRPARLMTHHFWFLTKTTAIPAQKLGFYEASYENGIKFLNKKEAIVLFPEGEAGNFKPSSQMYELQEFKRGFVRMSIETGAPIVPTLIVGAEETHINLSQLKFTKFLRGTVIPLPLNILPLPAKWKIVFLPPIRLGYPKSSVKDSELMRELAAEIQENMQAALNNELRKRNSSFF
ncbi:MAG: acyltransferase family protein [Bdellovibrionaceae bacterium]|nr:acyltransferase family protein [Pseudobdellovibrionaceae bacterium]